MHFSYVDCGCRGDNRSATINAVLYENFVWTAKKRTTQIMHDDAPNESQYL